MSKRLQIRRELRELAEEHARMAPTLAQLATAAAVGDDEALAIGRRWLGQWQATIARHCLHEEARLPLWLPGSPLLAQMVADHDAFRAAARRLELDPRRADVEALADRFRAHIAWEHDVLLPAVAAAMAVDPTELAPTEPDAVH
jgi:hypothetical protein